jgi:hypothetical protein
MRRARVVLTALFALLALSATPVAADAVYHTDQIAMHSVGDASGSGKVINIHPNGPTVFASERYMLRGAEPNATYQVWLVVDAAELDCAFTELPILMAASVTTNAIGNATTPADFYFTPEAVPPCLRDQSFPIHWEVTLDGQLTHRTELITVTLD